MDASLIEQNVQNNTEAFKHERWEITRGLRRKPNTPKLDRTEQYLDVLPTHNGKDLIQTIKEKVASGEKVRLLDIGCGAGLLAIDLRNEYPPEILDIEIIGHPKDIQVALWDVGRDVVRGPTEQELKDKQITFNFIDFSRLKDHDVTSLGRFDIVTASYSLEWLSHTEGIEDEFEENERRVIGSVKGLLKQKGVALIAPFNQKQNYEVNNLEKNHSGISFSKD